MTPEMVTTVISTVAAVLAIVGLTATQIHRSEQRVTVRVERLEDRVDRFEHHVEERFNKLEHDNTVQHEELARGLAKLDERTPAAHGAGGSR